MSEETVTIGNKLLSNVKLVAGLGTSRRETDVLRCVYWLLLSVQGCSCYLGVDVAVLNFVFISSLDMVEMLSPSSCITVQGRDRTSCAVPYCAEPCGRIRPGRCAMRYGKQDDLADGGCCDERALRRAAYPVEIEANQLLDP
jgi:hypothetical protein